MTDLKHIYVNFKRFDVPSELGGVNRLASARDYSKTIVSTVREELASFSGCEFVHFYPESQIPEAVRAAEGSVLKIGCQGVHRDDVMPGGNFGAFTTLRPAAAMAAIGCTHTIIGHCEERKNLAELFALAGSSDRTLSAKVLNKEVLAAQKRGIDVLFCVGEKDSELDEWDTVIREQLLLGLEGADLNHVAIAYEPVWSIGPGKTPADRPYITKVARLIKETLPGVPVVYGGGLKKDNAAMLASIDEIDGGLIALTRFTGEIGFYPEEYLEIIKLYLGV